MINSYLNTDNDFDYDIDIDFDFVDNNKSSNLYNTKKTIQGCYGNLIKNDYITHLKKRTELIKQISKIDYQIKLFYDRIDLLNLASNKKLSKHINNSAMTFIYLNQHFFNPYYSRYNKHLKDNLLTKLNYLKIEHDKLLEEYKKNKNLIYL